MSGPPVSVAGFVRGGWLAFRRRAVLFLVLAAAAALVQMLIARAWGQPSIAENLRDTSRDDWLRTFLLWGVVSSIPASILGLLQTGISARIALSAVDGGKEPWSVLVKDGIRGKVIGDLFLAGLVILAGFILCVIPGIVASVLFMFVPFLSLDGKKDALDDSIKVTKEQFWNMLVMGLLFLAAGWAVAVIPSMLFPRIAFVLTLVGGSLLGSVSLCCLAVLYRASSVGRVPGPGASEPPTLSTRPSSG